jgi:hypothetical protein
MAIGLSKWFKATFLGLEEKRVRTRDKDGKYVGDDKSTPDVNAAQERRLKRRGIK